MHEQLLYYLWKSKSFNTQCIRTTAGDEIQLIATGYQNGNAGPDFLEAKIKIDQVLWSGAVEMHVKSSEWIAHKHQFDPAYEAVILHVVWEDDCPITHEDGTTIPCLSLSKYVDQELLEKYQVLSEQLTDIPCQYALGKVSDIHLVTMLERTAIKRLETKADFVKELLKEHQNDWEEVTYQILMAGYGMKVNKAPMIDLSRSVSLKLLRKHHNDLRDIEALLFGQAGLISTSKNDYVADLQTRHHFFVHKHDLRAPLQTVEWKFGRLRPANFPTIRIAQIASYLHQHVNTFEMITQLDQVEDVKQLLSHETSDFWKEHHHFEKAKAKKTSNKIGDQMIRHLIINCFSPILVAASKFFDRNDYMDKAINWLETLDPENNKISRRYDQLGWKSRHALDSQAYLTLYSDYCLQKKCLDCSIGTAILRS